MASNVFGNPVTDDTVRLINPSVTTITAKDRAKAALLYMKAEDKATNVTKFVHNKKGSYGKGTSTLGMIYNATGGTLTYVMNHNWDGHIWQSPYPEFIQNGQWAGFLHVRGRLMGPCREAVVYRGYNNNGEANEWMLAWYTPRRNFKNHVSTDIRGKGEFATADWPLVGSILRGQSDNNSATLNGCFASASIGQGSSPEFVGIMSLEGLTEGDGGGIPSVGSTMLFTSLDSKYHGEEDDDDHDEDYK